MVRRNTAGANVTVDFDMSKLDRLFENLDVVAKVGYTADYAAYVEFPTEYAGSQPPFQPIRDWVHNKWDDLDSGLKDAGLPDDGSSIGVEEHKDRVAWIVVMAIADDGTDGVYFLNRGFEAAKQAGRQFLESFQDSDDMAAARKTIVETVDFAFEKSQDIVADEASDEGTLLQSGFVVVERAGETVFEAKG